MTIETLDLDEIDRGILHMLQLDARNHSAREIADRLDVAPNTVRNRIRRLEDAAVIEGFHPLINYEHAGFQLHAILECTVPVSKREEFAQQVMELDGTVEVTEILSGTENLIVECVATDGDDLTRLAGEIEELGIAISRERFVKHRRARPFGHFGGDGVGG